MQKNECSLPSSFHNCSRCMAASYFPSSHSSATISPNATTGAPFSTAPLARTTTLPWTSLNSCAVRKSFHHEFRGRFRRIQNDIASFCRISWRSIGRASANVAPVLRDGLRQPQQSRHLRRPTLCRWKRLKPSSRKESFGIKLNAVTGVIIWNLALTGGVNVYVQTRIEAVLIDTLRQRKLAGLILTTPQSSANRLVW